jgi:hypothetical protein
MCGEKEVWGRVLQVLMSRIAGGVGYEDIHQREGRM